MVFTSFCTSPRHQDENPHERYEHAWVDSPRLSLGGDIHDLLILFSFSHAAIYQHLVGLLSASDTSHERYEHACVGHRRRERHRYGG